jgi:DNA repair exonuclease SbcCD ATPase subunit
VRLKTITVEGFRAFGRSATIDLDADVIVLQGPNGVGKTSLLDAILWALAGQIARFQDRGSPVSIYAREGIARVELILSRPEGDLNIVRATDGNTTSVRLNTGTLELEGVAAQQELCNLLLPNLKDRAEATKALENVLTRGVYLQQDLVRQFIEVDSATDRFALVSEVIGAGVVLELQQVLEKSRNQWSRSTSAFRKDVIEPVETRLAQIDEQLSRLTEGANVEQNDARIVAENLHQQSISLLGRSRVGTEEPPTTPGRLDRFLKTLATERTRVEREIATSASLAEQVQNLDQSDVDFDAETIRLEQEEARLLTELRAADESLRNEIDRLEQDRERQVAERDRAKRLAALARLALDNLGEHCPVCEQLHDHEHTISHLNSLIEAASQDVPPTKSEDALSAFNAARSVSQQRVELIRTERRDLDNARRDREGQRAIVVARLADLGLDLQTDVSQQLEARRAEAQRVLESISRLLIDGERLSLNVVRLGERQRRDELNSERATLVSRLKEASEKAGRQDRTHAEAGKIIDGLRNASMLVTSRQIEQIAPLFQRIYSRIDPHPTFRVTQIAAGMERGKGHLHVGILDPEAGTKSRDAGPLLSSSQLNSYAVSLFLAMNLALPSLTLNATVLDDPLQSLDSINLLGLVDVLRRFRAHRQIIVSTHEERLMGLLQRKLRPVREGERIITMVFEGWTRDGPGFRVNRLDYTSSNDQVLAA